METLNAKYMIQQAKQNLEGKNATRLAAFHTGITVAAALVITALQFVLAEGIGNTSGLSGMGTRSVLQTVQTVLQWANMILIPFWGLGFLYASLRWAKGETARREDLLTGFRRIGPYIGLTLNRVILTIAVMIIVANISSILYMMTPAANPLTEMASGASSTEELYAILDQLSQQDLTQILYSMLPMMILWGCLCLVVLVPLLYRFRMAEYVILENPRTRGLAAMLISASMLRRRCWQLFKLDLRLWWYYGLKLLCTLLCYMDVLAGALGVGLPIGADGAYLVSYGLYLAALFAVETAFRPRVDTAYACAYKKLEEMGPAARKMAMPKPQDMPWDVN